MLAKSRTIRILDVELNLCHPCGRPGWIERASQPMRPQKQITTRAGQIIYWVLDPSLRLKPGLHCGIIISIRKETHASAVSSRKKLTGEWDELRFQNGARRRNCSPSIAATKELTKRRRRRQRRRYKTIGLVSKNNGSARSARAFYILVHFFAVIS